MLKEGITIFTPTYNRAYILENCYKSLLRQTDKRFVWLIVDDGSTDNTEELVKRFIVENKIENLDELYNIMCERKQMIIQRNGKLTGSARLSWYPLLIELYVDMEERGFTYSKMASVLGSESWRTAERYIGDLYAAGLLKSKTGKANDYVANEDIVKFVNGRKHESFSSSLFDEE